MSRPLGQLISILRLLGIAAVVWLAGRATAGMAATALMEPGAEEAVVFTRSPPSPQPKPAPTPTRKSTERLVESITDRNLFCRDCGPEPAAPPPPEDLEVTADGILLGRLLTPDETRTELPLSLVATMQSPRRGQTRSLCTVEHVERNQVAVYGRGDPVAPGIRIALIERGLVHLKTDEGYEYLPLRQPDEKKKKKRRRRRKKREKDKKRKRRSYEIPGADDAISCSKGGSCTIEREFVEKVLAKPSLLARQARVRAKAKNGDMVGFRLYRVRRKSLPRLLQLRSGDLLKAVNGRELDSMDAAMKMYRELRHASHFTVEVERRGKKLRMEYAVR